jgi:hypothetical protein
MEGRRVAVVGSGISGLSAAYLLHRWARRSLADHVLPHSAKRSLTCMAIKPAGAQEHRPRLVPRLPLLSPPRSAPSLAQTLPAAPHCRLQEWRPRHAVRERGDLRRPHADRHIIRLPRRPGLPGILRALLPPLPPQGACAALAALIMLLIMLPFSLSPMTTGVQPDHLPAPGGAV